MLWYNITCFIHYSLDRSGRWEVGMRDESPEILLHSVLFWAVVRFVTLSKVPAFSLSSATASAINRLSCRVKWPIRVSFRLLTVCSTQCFFGAHQTGCLVSNKCCVHSSVCSVVFVDNCFQMSELSFPSKPALSTSRNRRGGRRSQ